MTDLAGCAALSAGRGLWGGGRPPGIFFSERGYGMHVVDPKRTDVKASLIRYGEPLTFYEHNRLHGPPGAFIEREGMGLPNNWLLCCPGCGQASSPRDEAKWTAPQGSFADVTTLTLQPSIAMGCCGWHGFLTAGTFESC